MIKISLWKRVLSILVCLIALYVTLPVFYNIDVPFIRKNITLGLDLRGGSSILLEVDEKSYIEEQMRISASQIYKSILSSGLKVDEPEIDDKGFIIKNIDQKDLINIESAIGSSLGYAAKTTYQDYNVYVEYQPHTLRDMRNELINQTLKIISRRIDESGTKEIDLHRQGQNYIALQVPGVYDPTHLKNLLGQTAKLTFHMVEDTSNSKTQFGYNVSKPGSKLLPVEDKDDSKNHLYVKILPVISGDMLLDARVSLNIGMPVVNFRLNDVGAKIFGDFTLKNKGKRLAIVLDNKILSAPVINEPILGGSGIISGNFSMQKAEDLAILLRAGALPAPIKIAQENIVGPSLGSDSIESGKKAIAIGVCSIILVMLIVYKFFGFIANIALIMNLILIFAVMIILDITVTLPSIAAVVLTLGMAVDANVLIFERIKEELRNGNPNITAIKHGYDSAFITILDSNITTVIAGFMLYIFGYGPVRGFAVALSIGIFCSMFTAITLTKIMIADWLKFYKPTKLSL